MPHTRNGQHRPSETIDSRFQSAIESAEGTGHQIEKKLGDLHHQLLEKSSTWIRQYPGTSLLVAFAIGGVCAWFIKRRS